MAKQRMVNTRLWSDGWIRDTLNPLDRYLFLYLLTNEHTSLCGVYELPLGTMSSETGIEKEMLEKTMIKNLEPKVYYIGGWIYIRNFVRYQNPNPSILRGIERSMEELPSKIRNQINNLEQAATSLHAVSMQPKPELKLEPKPIDKSIGGSELPTPKMEAKEFFDSIERQDEMILQLTDKGIPEAICRREVQAFVLHWSELNATGKKQRWELEKTFEVTRRLAKWFNNYQKWNKAIPQKKGHVIL